MKAYSGSGGIVSRILDLGTRWKWVSFTPSRVAPREGASVNHWTEAGWAPEPVSTRWWQIPSPGQDSTLNIIQLVAQSYTTELSRLVSMKVLQVVVCWVVALCSLVAALDLSLLRRW
jgi:hypothetical protein